jgi:long-subunit fatty acid transport protein
MLRGDIGAGDSDFTATLATGFRYNINEYLDFDIQYKALWVNYETGTPNRIGHFNYDTNTYGPSLGVNIKF